MSCLCTACRRPEGKLVTVPFFMVIPNPEDPAHTLVHTSTSDHKTKKATRAYPIQYPKALLVKTLAAARALGCTDYAIENLEALL